MKKINFGVVGVGHIGKRHSSMVLNNKNCELIAFCDVKNKNELGLESFKGVSFYNNIKDMLNNHPEIDVVCICTPNGLHSKQAIQSLENNKHVIIEKPIGLKISESEKVLHAALQNHKQVFAVMQNRYSPPSMWLKEIVDKKIIGDIFMAQVNCYWNRDDRYYKKGGWKGTQEQDGGTLFTQFSHFIDIMYWLFGDIENIQGKFNDFTHQESTDFEDSGIVSFDFKNGGMGCLNYSTAVWDSNLESSITIIGSKGSVKVGGQYMNEIEYCNIKDYEMPTLPPSNPPNDYGQYKGSAANHHYIIQNVVETLRGQNVATTNVLEGLKVVEIIEKIYDKR
jgi:UDP-N-acetyl-2-amino-2-deoxyglucuronate dehydrogenase|tara:strand:- start:19665 stop:20675 length:1011 start_codon:yes stop_codon:yes gene_type:complete